jgi:hypothetical protein
MRRIARLAMSSFFAHEFARKAAEAMARSRQAEAEERDNMQAWILERWNMETPNALAVAEKGETKYEFHFHFNKIRTFKPEVADLEERLPPELKIMWRNGYLKINKSWKDPSKGFCFEIDVTNLAKELLVQLEVKAAGKKRPANAANDADAKRRVKPEPID